MLEMGPRNVIVKARNRGYYLASGEHRAFVPAFQVQAVDTTAAGDAFNGALATEGSVAIVVIQNILSVVCDV
jgi:ribokinase